MWTAPEQQQQVIYAERPSKPKKRRKWQTWTIIVLGILGIVLILFWYLKRTLDPITKGVLSGAGCGLLAAIPMSIILLVIVDRRRASHKEQEQTPSPGLPMAANAWNPLTGPMPPVVIYTGQQPLPQQPTRPLNWTAGPIEREFRVLGDPPLDQGQVQVSDLKLWGED